MLRVASLLVALAALAAIVVAAVQRAAPKIEADIAARASVALVGAGIDWARVATDGRTLTLTGTAPDAASHATAVATVTALPGVKAVQNRLSKTAARPRIDAGLVIARGPGEIRLEGTVRDADSVARLTERARAAFPGLQIVEQLDVTHTAPGARAGNALDALPALALLQTGRITFLDDTAELEGMAPSPAGRELASDAFRKAMPADMSASITVEVPVPHQSAQTCQIALDRIMSDNVSFVPNEAAINPESHDLLDQATRVILACPGLDIAVGAHTDSGGDEQTNVALTQKRADEVVRYLVEGGVPSSRLAAQGYGSSRPLTSNDSRSGRRSNRRIQITVKNQAT